MRAVVVVLGLVMFGVMWHLLRRGFQTASTRDARCRLRDLRELVTAWQLAHGDEVRVMNQRVASAQASMAATERGARACAEHLDCIERAVLTDSG